jgi:hypothetical protein
MIVLLTFATVTFKGIMAKRALGCRGNNSFAYEEDLSDQKRLPLPRLPPFLDDPLTVSRRLLSKTHALHDCSQILSQKWPQTDIYQLRLSLYFYCNLERENKTKQFCRVKYGPSSIIRFNARCDMQSLGGGWTVFQSRGQFENPADFFNRSWKDYVHGFGDEQGEYWMGLNLLQVR